MEIRQTKSRLISFRLVATLFCINLLWSCSGGNSASDDSTSASGTLSFNVVYHDGTGGNRQSKAASIDCAGQGVDTVEAKVYDSGVDFVASGGPWDCDAGQGTITSVPAGSGLSVVLWGKDADGNNIFRGLKENIRVIADSENNVGTIDCYAFVATLLAPVDGSTFDPGAMFLQWEAVAGATEYRVLVSQNSRMNDPVINDVTTKANHAPSGLSGGETYYWQVLASDSEGNMGIGSQIWSFTTPANISPVAQISIPAKGSTYIVGQEREFSGSGNDSEDGILSGASLVWASDVVGPIGTGENCSWRPIDDTHAGTHKIILTATDSQGATGTDTVVITVATGRLPDTGQEQLEDYEPIPGEDMTYSIHTPIYTKLDKEGNELAADAINWAMVRDDVTGLIWEVKTDDGTIHDMGNGYSWQGARDDFIAEFNQEEFGGYNDWRLPTIKELAVIVHRGLQDRTMHPVYFPNVISNFYWAATTNANNTDEAWTVIFQDGIAFYNRQKLEINSVRAVRGGQSTGILMDNNDGTVTDTATGLIWQQAEAGSMSWEEALTYCENLEEASYEDWRLPNVNELQSIVNYDKESSNEDPAIEETIFPNALGAQYWTATTNAINMENAWTVGFSNGSIAPTSKSNSNNVRAVRGGL